MLSRKFPVHILQMCIQWKPPFSHAVRASRWGGRKWKYDKAGTGWKTDIIVAGICVARFVFQQNPSPPRVHTPMIAFKTARERECRISSDMMKIHPVEILKQRLFCQIELQHNCRLCNSCGGRGVTFKIISLFLSATPPPPHQNLWVTANL